MSVRFTLGFTMSNKVYHCILPCPTGRFTPELYHVKQGVLPCQTARFTPEFYHVKQGGLPQVLHQTIRLTPIETLHHL